LSKREEEIVELKKEKDLLSVALEQAKAQNAATAAAVQGATAAAAANAKLAADLAEAQRQATEANMKLEAENRELSALRAPAANRVSPAEVAELTQERDKLTSELAQRNKDLADAEAHRDQDMLDAHAQLADAVAQRDALQKKLDAANASSTTAADTAEIGRLRARVAVLEAKAVPYTPEELAMLKQTPQQPGLPPDSTATKPHPAHSSKDLPPGAGALMGDATRASMERDFAGAEEKYKEVLSQDENNVYVLAFLADAQFAEGHLGDCEKTVNRAMALDPDDPATLYVLGLLRYRQERLDEALDALSRSAKLNDKKASTQNFLGCVLADKGLRPQAETAFRKALQLEPDYSDAHYNLAFIYATEKPASPELARWHYKRAVDLGHPKNPRLEAILATDK
jgi:tetratricopeptide (TPR) repeat protein